MDLREAVEKYKQFQIPTLSIICEKAKQHSKTCLLTVIILFFLFIYLIHQVPHWQVAQFGIMNPKDLADAENSYRATLAQILGGIAIGIGLYYTWRRISIAEENLRVAQESQINERFTQAVDQLGAVESGCKKLEIRLGGIYALEGIANDFEKYYSQIIEILTAYIRMNSYIRDEDYTNLDFKELSNKAFLNTKLKESPEIQAIITVISRRKKFLDAGEIYGLEFQKTYLRAANFQELLLIELLHLEVVIEKFILKEPSFTMLTL